MYDQIQEKIKKIQPVVNYDTQIPRAAVAIVITKTEKILMFRRKIYPQDPWSGHMAFPGGKKEVHDRDLLMTAMRESQEELGIILPPSSIRLSDFSHKKLIVSAFVFFIDDVVPLFPNEEVDTTYWIDLHDLFVPQYRTVFRPNFQPDTDFSIVYVPNVETGIWGISLSFIDQIGTVL